jgi:putative ABC transport system permease protein
MDRLPFLEQILEKVKVLPGVRQAALISDLPTDNNGGFNDFLIEGRPAPKGKDRAYEALMRMVSPGYFELMGVPLRRGRFPLPSDRKGSLLVAVIDEAMAKTFWPGEDPVGKRFTLGGKKFFTVIGIAGSVREAGLMGGQEPHMYLVLAQIPGATQFMNRIVAKTEGNPLALSTGVREAVHQVDPDQPVSRIRALDQMVSNTVAKPRFSLLLLGLFALLALVLSIVGIFGVTAYSVSQRTRELGLRMALGAERGGVLRMVVQEAGTLAGLGVLIGVVLAFFVTRVMSSLLYGISATDPLTFVGISLGLVVISLAAAYLPGRKATRVDPIVALRAE